MRMGLERECPKPEFLPSFVGWNWRFRSGHNSWRARCATSIVFDSVSIRAPCEFKSGAAWKIEAWAIQWRSDILRVRLEGSRRPHGLYRLVEGLYKWCGKFTNSICQ